MTSPTYGYLHRGRVLRPGEAEGHYVVHIPALAPGCASGPFQSTVRDLQTGDNVLLAQVGLTGGDLVVVGRLPERGPDVTLPIAISDVTGLQTALDNRATDAELAAAVSTLNASITTEHNTNVTQDGRLTSVEGRMTTNEALDVTQNGRLTTAEGNITTNTGTIGGHTSTLATHTSQISALQTYAQVFQSHEFDIYGDLWSPFPRMWTSNFRTLANNTGYFWLTRARVAATSTRVRVIVTTAGTVGNCTGTLLKSSTLAGTYAQAGSGTNNLQVTGPREFTFTGVNIAQGDYVMMFFVGGGYSVAPRIAALANAVQNNAALNPIPIWGTKGGLAAAPTTIAPTDGTWTGDTAPWWVAAA